jgi:nicotinamidase-related amidase
MATYQELLQRHVDRSNSFITSIDPRRTVLLMLDVQKLCLDLGGHDYVPSVGGAPSGVETLGPAKKVLDLARAEGMPVMWSLWGHRPDRSDAGISKFKVPGCDGTPESPWSHGTWNGEIVDGFDPLPGEPVLQKHRFSTFYGTPFNEWLREVDADCLVIVGSSTANCVQATAQDGWNRAYKVIVIADAGTAVPLYVKGKIPLWEQEVPLGYGQHWEALRTIQASYADVMTHDEFIELVYRSKASGAPAVPSSAAKQG